MLASWEQRCQYTVSAQLVCSECSSATYAGSLHAHLMLQRQVLSALDSIATQSMPFCFFLCSSSSSSSWYITRGQWCHIGKGHARASPSTAAGCRLSTSVSGSARLTQATAVLDDRMTATSNRSRWSCSPKHSASCSTLCWAL